MNGTHRHLAAELEEAAGVHGRAALRVHVLRPVTFPVLGLDAVAENRGQAHTGVVGDEIILGDADERALVVAVPAQEGSAWKKTGRGGREAEAPDELGFMLHLDRSRGLRGVALVGTGHIVPLGAGGCVAMIV